METEDGYGKDLQSMTVFERFRRDMVFRSTVMLIHDVLKTEVLTLQDLRDATTLATILPEYEFRHPRRYDGPSVLLKEVQS